jgi:hypothetical protein
MPVHGTANRSACGACVREIYRCVEYRHQVEIEVWPPAVTLNFEDEWTANPINAQTRFAATVFNSSQGALWEVHDVLGNPGAGSIDATGLYRAPPKGALPDCFTEVVVATAREDRLRKAYAWVTLVGTGPAAAPRPSVEIWPRRVNLYYRQGFNNNYIDDSNKMRLFTATASHDPAPAFEWLVDGVVQGGATDPWFLYQAPGNGGTQVVTVSVRNQAQAAIRDDARVLLLNYTWPAA